MTATIGRSKNKPAGDRPRKLPIIAAAIALVLVGIAGWFFAGNDQTAIVEEQSAVNVTEPSVTESDVPVKAAAVPKAVPAAAAEPAPTPEYVALLDNARFARDSGRLLTPAGDNAIEWYIAARASAPENAIVRDELTALVDQVIGMAETALLENRTDDASNALAMIATASPDNTRLTFLNAQLAQMQMRSTLDRARAAIRDSRFEDANRDLARAQNLPGADLAQITQLAEDLASARSAERVEDTLEQASLRLANDQLTAPSNDNARYFYELALSNDPGNTAAQQGLLVVAGKLVLRARAAIDSGDFDLAASYLDDARVLDPESNELQASDNALQSAIRQRAEDERLAAAARQTAADEAEAQRAMEMQRRAAASATLSSGTMRDDTEPGSNETRTATQAPADSNGSTGAPALPTRNTSPSPVVPAPDRARSSSATPETIAVSELTRINYVAPKYPRNAQRRNVKGWVDVGFTVTTDGSVTNLEVIDSTPGTVFDSAATEAVEQWRFEPVIENGRPVPKRAAVRMSFSIE